MRQKETMTWFEEREKECEESQEKEKELTHELADLNRKIQVKKEEQNWWQRYISWIKEEPKKRMEDPDAALQFCEGMQKEVAEQRKRLIEEFEKTRSKLDRIKHLGCFVR